MAEADALWESQGRAWRNPAQAIALDRGVADIDRSLLASKASGDFWDLLERLGITLIVGREYEHLVVALTARDGRPYPTYMALPHPSGIVADRAQNRVFIACTRNPNQIFAFRPVTGMLCRDDRPAFELAERPLVPVASQFLPGSLYIHDLAIIEGRLYANAVGHNAIARIDSDGYKRVWWPQGIERRRVPDFNRNYIQLNSIAAGRTFNESFFSASSEAIGARRPGQRNYPVDGRGVIFAAATRQPVVRGLTRPHSARLWRRRLFVLNSGYGQFGVIDGGRFVPIAQLPGWTRGLAFHRGYAFVGVSRIIPRFRAYAPGLEAGKSVCGVFIVELGSGRVIASLVWPMGNQIFAIDWLHTRHSSGFPFPASGRQKKSRLEQLFYAYQIVQ